ncbi:hypothetical protein UA08_01879 [Talaromyces atroroseus]|uniref:Uncharacterized protein n=1 Tax=Talaromyces atroroseus TaxID=1441469 RepID=A0A1Q5QAH5_TALAT|nr:hypothetical protein UA08_01879 [Talaromyces atroroseus]OKL62808.1 hypothetical protein UA08_01879 [Talaromyces atroroseus]
MKYFSRNSKELPSLEEITVVRPARYSVYYFPVRDGNNTGVLTKFLSWGARRHFLKKWLGGYRFQAEPIAVRQMGENGSFPDLPDQTIWESATLRRLPSEFKEERVENIMPSAIPSKRRRESAREGTESGLTSVSSSGSDIPPQIITGTSVQESGNNTSGRASRHASSDDDSEEDEEEEDEDEAAPTGLSNEGLPVLARSLSRTGLVHGSSNAQGKSDRSRPARETLSKLLNTRLLTSPLVNTSGTSDSGVDMSTSSSSALPTIIKFKFMVPRTKMVRDLRVENNEENSEYLFNQAREFFRRYDRLVGTPVSECVVEGEPECRCIYNAKELSYYIEELRERRGIVKVTVTQSS